MSEADFTNKFDSFQLKKSKQSQKTLFFDNRSFSKDSTTEIWMTHNEQPDRHDLKFYFPKQKYWNEDVYA